MTVAVIGATGHVGSEIVRGLLKRGEAVDALVRDANGARRMFGEPDGLKIRSTQLDDPSDVTEALKGIRTIFIAMGSVGIQGVLQRIAISVASTISSIEQVTRLSVLNASANSLGINQRAHDSIDRLASALAVPYSTIRPAIFQLSLLAAGHQVRASRTWTGLADSGRVALIDHRDVAEAGLRVLTEPALWGQHHDLTGPVPVSWPEALELLSAELGETVTFRTATVPEFLARLINAGIPAGEAELLIAREWAVLAGENDYTTDSFQQITGRSPRRLEDFLHEHRAEFA
ncbi:NmrA family NAD(P)-binding protein [Kribbella jiaozuonensis]|uniref:NAD-dependent epimerase/dehydratase family protein n=1 Tax=Kribbella jiaozuonensis TaxID=2575441 RepID=A0A4U3M3U6_9ACTN|nr:NmrA family NAD(P)-binding protein [Kribbella jiaozuonensis]TKK82799.1 NAD-dependent epimerase/dehydratase family protein [Kribbella jiaozuonensis]